MMTRDPVGEEVRRIRDAYAKRFGYGVVRDFKALSSAPPEMRSAKKFFPLL